MQCQPPHTNDILHSWSNVEAKAETKQVGVKAKAKQKLVIKGQKLNSLVLYQLINFSVLVFKCLCSVQDYNTVIEISAIFDEHLLKFRLELKNPSYHKFNQPTKRTNYDCTLGLCNMTIHCTLL